VEAGFPAFDLAGWRLVGVRALAPVATGFAALLTEEEAARARGAFLAEVGAAPADPAAAEVSGLSLPAAYSCSA
jgi:hypothetical protein